MGWCTTPLGREAGSASRILEAYPFPAVAMQCSTSVAAAAASASGSSAMETTIHRPVVRITSSAVSHPPNLSAVRREWIALAASTAALDLGGSNSIRPIRASTAPSARNVYAEEGRARTTFVIAAAASAEESSSPDAQRAMSSFSLPGTLSSLLNRREREDMRE